jgi:hypothetical protein
MTSSERMGCTPAQALLPCPFCGGEDLTVYAHKSVGSWVACIDCGLETPTETGITPEDATKYWNIRVPACNAHDDLVKALEGLLNVMAMEPGTPARYRAIELAEAALSKSSPSPLTAKG